MDDRIVGIIQTIERNPLEDWSLESAAALAGYSPFHFHRIFRAATGFTLHQFVRDRQMLVAAKHILLEDRLEDIACRFHYSSPEAFSRSFKNHTGMSPAEFRECPIPMPAQAEIAMRGIANMKSKIIELEQDISVVGVQVRTNPPMDLNISLAWKGLSDRWMAIGHKAPQPRTFGLEQYSADERSRSNGITYTACVEVAKACGLPDGTVSHNIPAGTYAVFTHRGPTETLDQSFRYIYTEGLTLAKLQPGGDFDLEVYDDRFQDGSPDSELDIYIPVKPA